MSNNIWVAGENQFCVRYMLDDLPGFFRSQLTISPGMKAFIWADGTTFGEVPAGTYTLETFTEKLAFWRAAKVVDAILVREEDLRLKLAINDLATADQVLVRAEVQVTVQMADLGMFMKNLLGTSREITKEMLLNWILPMAQQSLREAVRKLTIQELMSADVRLMIQAALAECSALTLSRYGLRLNEVHTVSIYNEAYDAQLKKVGQSCLLRVQLDAEKKLGEVRDQEAFAKIERLEREQELDVLAKNVQLDREEAEVELQLRQCDVRKMMREAVLSDRFDKVNNEEEFAKFMEEIDKQKLLRDDETDELKQIYREKGADREKLALTLALTRKGELDRLETEILHAQKIQALKHEAELTKVTQNAENLQARENLEASIAAENLRFEDNLQKLQSQHKLNAEAAKFLNAAQMTQLLHEQDAARVKAEADYETAVAEVKIRQIKYEFQKTVQADNLRALGEMQDLKAKSRREKMELAKEMKQQELDHRLAEMQARRGMTAAELAAGADPENAKYLAEMEAARNNAGFQQQLQELQQQRVEDAQKLLDKTLETIQGITGQAFGAVAGYGATAGQALPPGAPRVMVCAACRAENPRGTKFCSNCGKEL